MSAAGRVHPVRLGVGPTAVDRETAGRRVPWMREHLSGCPACAEEYASLRDLLREVQVR